jgi:hypothetical protein
LIPTLQRPLSFDFLPALLRATPFSNGKQQLDGVAINDQEKARIGQEALVPVLMRHQQPLQPCAIGQTGKQGIKVSFEPTIKGAKVASFQGEQQADRHQLAWIQLGLIMLGYLFHSVIDKAKQMDDNVFGGHNDLVLSRVFLFFSLGHDCCDHLNSSLN